MRGYSELLRVVKNGYEFQWSYQLANGDYGSRTAGVILTRTTIKQQLVELCPVKKTLNVS